MKIEIETENGPINNSAAAAATEASVFRMGTGAWIALALLIVASPFFIYSMATKPAYVPVHQAPMPPLFPGHPVASKAAELALDLLWFLAL